MWVLLRNTLNYVLDVALPLQLFLARPPKLPLMKTTNTAAYAAQAAKTSDLLAFVTKPTHIAKAIVYPAIRPRRFCSSVT